MDADHRPIDVRDPVAQHGDRSAHVRGDGVADGVRDVDRRGAGIDGRFDHFAQEVVFGPRRILGRELDVVTVSRRAPHAFDGPLDDLLGRHPQFEFAVDRAGGQEDVDPRPFGQLQRLPSPVDVRRIAPRQPADRRPADDPEISRTASKSPGEAIGNPASMMSTPSTARAWAISSFSFRFMLAPGDCSPSRSVVSKILICLNSSHRSSSQ
jgi:hypothetical protein